MTTLRPLSKRSYRLVAVKLLPMFLIGQFLLQLDRTNISFAALQMNQALGVTSEVFGLAAGIFFIGYALFEVPSNLILQRVAANKWIGALLLGWGLLTLLLAFSPNATFVVVLRFLLGVFEGGFVPGMLLVLTQWLPAAQRGRAVALTTLAVPLAAIVGGPLAGSLLQLSLAGLPGWHWMFLVEGAATVIFALVWIRIIPRGPEQAHWLPLDDRKALAKILEAERAAHAADNDSARSFAVALRSRPVWVYVASYLALSIGYYGIFFWLPQILKSLFTGLTSFDDGLVSAVPYICGAIALVVAGFTSDHTGDRRRHLALFGFVAAVGLLLSLVVGNPIVAFIALCIAVSCGIAYLAVFWSSPMSVLSAAAAAGGIAVINSLGNLGGFLGPYVAGLLTGPSDNFDRAIAFFAVALVLAGMIPVIFRKQFPSVQEIAGRARRLPTSAANADDETPDSATQSA
jgi:ACS family tartrate transporter-like MFS transporter